MKNYYRPNEHERYADFIEEMLKALKTRNKLVANGHNQNGYRCIYYSVVSI